MPIEIASASAPTSKVPLLEATPSFKDGDMHIVIHDLEDMLESGDMHESGTGGSATIVNVTLPNFDLVRADGTKHVLKTGRLGFYVSLTKNKRSN